MGERKISTKFAIQGESEYKNAVKSINQEMKVLNSEMAKVQSEFDGAANSMEALAAQGDVLAQQYETQAERVETMREALQNAKDAQQEWGDRLEEATERVNELTQQLEELENAEGDTTEEQARLREELERATEAQEYAQAGYEAATKGVQDWQTRLNYAEADLNKLNEKLDQNDRLMGEAAASSDKCAKSIDQYGKATQDAGEGSDQMGNLGSAAIQKIIGGGGGGLMGLVGWAVKLVGAAKDIAVEMKNAEAIIVKGTGAEGEALRELNETYKEVMGNAKSSSDVVAGLIAVLNTRLHMTGDELQENTELFEQFGRAASIDAAEGANEVVDVMNAFGKSAEDIPHILDLLTVAGQNSKDSVAALTGALSDSAFYAQQSGMSLEQTIAMFAALNNAGIDYSLTVRGMQKSYEDFTKTGRTFPMIMQGIADGTISASEATDLFGKKGALLFDYVRDGKVEFDYLTEAIGAADGKMVQTAENAETFGEKVKGFWNSVWFGGESGSQYTGFYQIEQEADSATEVIEDRVVPSFEEAWLQMMELANGSEFTSESINALTDFLISNEAQALQNADGYQEMKDQLFGVGAQMQQLEAETAAATEGVRSNLDSMMGRFNEVPAVTATSVAQVVSNLNSQLAYMDTYAANMKTASERGVNDGLLKSLSDGSQESAEILAGLVNATDEDIAVLNAKWNKTQEGRETFSETLGQMQTDFQEKSAALKSEYDAAIQHFNKYGEAQAAGAKTMQGVLAGIASVDIVTPMFNKGKSAAQAYANGFNSVPPPKPKTSGFAAGTDSAEFGLHWVGEAGPEILMFSGGETVFNHEESVRLAREAMEAAARADSRTGADLSANVVSVTVKNDADLERVETLLAGVIEAVESIEPVSFGAIADGVDRRMARQRKLVGMSGG